MKLMMLIEKKGGTSVQKSQSILEFECVSEQEKRHFGKSEVLFHDFTIYSKNGEEGGGTCSFSGKNCPFSLTKKTC